MAFSLTYATSNIKRSTSMAIGQRGSLMIIIFTQSVLGVEEKDFR